MAIVERARKKKASRITNLREGDANTKYFHLKMNARRRKNFIQRLRIGNMWRVKHEEKAAIIKDHFEAFLARPAQRTIDLDWDILNLPILDCSMINGPISEEEVHVALKQLPGDKAPGLDGFTGAFYKACWEIIKADVMAVIHSFDQQRSNNLSILNSANVVLIPKKEGAESIGDYRPISLIHGVAKLLSKTLALRLQPHMGSVISHAQSAFIKKRSIHDNFMYARNLARTFHQTRTPALLLKLDISKAFDSVRLDYLIDLLQRKGFPPRWTNWISNILVSSTTRVLLNGCPGAPIKHVRGLRQGDPLPLCCSSLLLTLFTTSLRKQQIWDFSPLLEDEHQDLEPPYMLTMQPSSSIQVSRI